MKAKITFYGCKYLDFSTKYRPSCKRQLLGSGKLFWMRPPAEPSRPQMVQFCSKRGRLNSPESCLDQEHAHCSDYTEHKHIVEVDQEELES